MRVFISWSGDLSKQVAELLREWIKDVLQGTETWISTEDIDKGSLWFGDISGQLSETSVGILCLTRENMTSPWILFEAGALAKGLSKSRVCPLLVNLKYADLKPPLSMFNGTLPTKKDMLMLVKTINAQNGDKRLAEEERVEKAFGHWWEEFEAKFKGILTSYKPRKESQSRSSDDMLQEVLQIVRSLQNSWLSTSSSSPPKLMSLPTYSELAYQFRARDMKTKLTEFIEQQIKEVEEKKRDDVKLLERDPAA